MVKPDDDFDDDYDDDNDIIEVEDDGLSASANKPNMKQHDTRRKIEDILERRRLKDEFGDYLEL